MRGWPEPPGLQHPPSVLPARVTDAAFNFLLVWYYCTLTIRESILINNGSRWVRPRPGHGFRPPSAPRPVPQH